MKHENDPSARRSYLRIGVLLLSLLILAVGIGVSAKYVSEKKLFHGSIAVSGETSDPVETENAIIHDDISEHQLPADQTEEPAETEAPADPIETEPVINDPNLPTQKPDSES